MKSVKQEVSESVTVVAAAIRKDGITWWLTAPARHHDIIHHMILNGVKPPCSGIQGFILSDGDFAGRAESKAVARLAGQLLERASTSAGLFSEDVW